MAGRKSTASDGEGKGSGPLRRLERPAGYALIIGIGLMVLGAFLFFIAFAEISQGEFMHEYSVMVRSQGGLVYLVAGALLAGFAGVRLAAGEAGSGSGTPPAPCPGR